MRRECISLETERTNPKFSSNVDLAVCASFRWGGGGCHAVGEVDAPVWIQNGSTRGLACNGVVKDWGKILSMLEGCV